MVTSGWNSLMVEESVRMSGVKFDLPGVPSSFTCLLVFFFDLLLSENCVCVAYERVAYPFVGSIVTNRINLEGIF